MDSAKETSYRIITSYLSGTIFTTKFLENLQLERSKLIEFKIVCLVPTKPSFRVLISIDFRKLAVRVRSPTTDSWDFNGPIIVNCHWCRKLSQGVANCHLASQIVTRRRKLSKMYRKCRKLSITRRDLLLYYNCTTSISHLRRVWRFRQWNPHQFGSDLRSK